jgi:hypothetical protein
MRFAMIAVLGAFVDLPDAVPAATLLLGEKIHMELVNDTGDQIAAGSAAYIVG